jgi:hypothetical protein
MTPASKLALSAGYQPSVKSADDDGVSVGDAPGDAVPVAVGLTVVALGVADGVSVEDGVAGAEVVLAGPVLVGAVLTGPVLIGPVLVGAGLAGPVLVGTGVGGDPVKGPARALPPKMAEVTMRNVLLPITIHFSTLMPRVIPANDSS